MKEYKLQVPDDTVGISITTFRQTKNKKLFSRSFNVEAALETYKRAGRCHPLDAPPRPAEGGIALERVPGEAEENEREEPLEPI